jgi:O-acetyl-ADP-ribose deacetylase (regulator of RNase III)
MGGGIALSIKHKFPKAFKHYSDWYNDCCKFNNNKFLPLGITQFIPINNTLDIANMISQHDIYEIDNIPPIRYEALENCLNQVANYSKIKNAQVIGPKFGSGLAGGDWNIIQKIIHNQLCIQNIQVTIFEL